MRAQRAFAGQPLPMRGFTLIEVLVALTIVAVALLTALRATASLAVASQELRLRTLAQWSAENRLAAIRVSGALPPVGRNTYDCPQAGEPLSCDEQVFAMPSPLFVRIEINVTGGEDRRALTRLVAFPGKLQ
jgi:general secretion pathway protein I